MTALNNMKVSGSCFYKFMKITAQPYTAYFRIYTLWPGVRKDNTLITQIAKLLSKEEVAF